MIRKFLVNQVYCACYMYDILDAKDWDETGEEYVNRLPTKELWWLFFNKVKHYITGGRI